MAKIKEFEEKYNALVYAVTHEYTNFGECYDFLYIPDYEKEWDEMLYPQGNMFYAYACQPRIKRTLPKRRHFRAFCQILV